MLEHKGDNKVKREVERSSHEDKLRVLVGAPRAVVASVLVYGVLLRAGELLYRLANWTV